jgi:hypothetical protein
MRLIGSWDENEVGQDVTASNDSLLAFITNKLELKFIEDNEIESSLQDLREGIWKSEYQSVQDMWAKLKMLLLNEVFFFL